LPRVFGCVQLHS